METHEAVLGRVEEAAAGHRAHANLSAQVDGAVVVVLIAQARDVGHDVVGSLRLDEVKAQVAQAVAEEVAFVGVERRELVVVGLRQREAGHGSLHERRGGTHGEEVVNLSRAVDDVCRRNDVAQAPAGHGVGLGQGAAGQRALLHARQAREVDVLVGRVDDVLVDLVRDDPQVVLLGHLGDRLELGAAEDVAAGVGRVAQDECLGAGDGARSLELGLVKGERGSVELHVGGLGAAQDRVGPVVLVERAENDDAVARVRDGHDRAHHGLGGATRDHDLGLRVNVETHARALLGGKRGAKVGGAPGDGVLVWAGVGHLGEAVGDLRGRVEVREALGQVDGVILHGHARHAADHGVRELRRALAELLHGSSPTAAALTHATLARWGERSLPKAVTAWPRPQMSPLDKTERTVRKSPHRTHTLGKHGINWYYHLLS